MTDDIELQLVRASVDRGTGRSTVRAVDDASLLLRRGESMAIMGGTGSGKTTLALALAGLVPLAAGRLEGPAVGRVAMALQRPEASFVCERVLDEVVVARTWQGESFDRAAPLGRAALAELGLGPDVDERDPLALSGGEQRRVAIAAVLAVGPRVLVLDEPSAGLDGEARAHLHAAIGRLRAAGRSIVIVTHDPAEGASLADRLVVLGDGGRILHDGPPAAILADPLAAQRCGIAVAPEVHLLAASARARGMTVPRTDGRPDSAVAALAHLLVEQPMTAPRSVTPPELPGRHRAPVDQGAASRKPMSIDLPPPGEPRLRLLAFGLVVTATFVATSVAASVLVVAVLCSAALLVRVRRSRLVASIRSLVLLALLLIVAQRVVGGAPDVVLYGDVVEQSGMLAAVRRILQIVAVVLASLVLTETTGPASLAAGLRTLLAPLRLVRVPVDDAALVVSSGLGFVPVLADELDRLSLAQRARGIRPRGRGPLAMLRLRSMLVVPLIVLAFRRAHLLAEAMHVRGYVRGAPRTAWRRYQAGPGDVGALAVGIAMLVLAWLL